MSYFKACSDGLNWIASASFRLRPKSPDLANRHVLLLSHAFENLSSEERRRIIDNLAPGVDMKLLALSGFIAEAAINTRNAALIKAALILNLLENFRKDYRENIRYLVLIAFVANELGVNLPFVINSILHIASDQAKQHLVDFSGREPELNKLSSFGVKGEMSGGISNFRPCRNPTQVMLTFFTVGISGDIHRP